MHTTSTWHARLRESRVMANQHPEDVDCGYDRHLAERYLTEPAMYRHMPEHSRDPESRSRCSSPRSCSTGTR